MTVSEIDVVLYGFALILCLYNIVVFLICQRKAAIISLSIFYFLSTVVFVCRIIQLVGQTRLNALLLEVYDDRLWY